MNYLTIGEAKIEYELRVSRRSKRIRLAMYPGGRVVISVPYGSSAANVSRFLHSKAKWIMAKHSVLKNARVVSPEASRSEYLLYKDESLRLAKERLQFFNRHYGFKYGKVTVRNQTSLWGSCSRKGNLNFNYKIALLPPDQADYVIVHELCHLKEFNHSQSFWSLVAQTVPDYKAIRKALKAKGLGLLI